MSRIKCRTPSTGKPLTISLANVGTALTTVSEAPDFSVPDASNTYTVRDPLDTSRAIRPGEIFFLTPLAARNKSTSLVWVSTSLYTENNVRIELANVAIPANDTAFIPVQGRSLFKRTANTSNGDIIQIQASISNAIDVWAAAEEKLSSEHIGVE
jgi:hypothetical protein